MFIITKTKKSVVLLAMMMHMSVYGITEFQAKVGTVVAGLVGLAGASMVSNYDNPGIGVVGLGSAGLAYNFLSKYTARVKLENINLELDKINAKGYGNCWVSKNGELESFEQYENLFSPTALERSLGTEDHQNFITGIVFRSRGNGEHSLAVAYEELKPLHEIVNKSYGILKNMHEDAQADGLLDQLQKTYNRCQLYCNDLSKVDFWIKKSTGFADENAKYQQSKKESEQLKINQQTADAAEKSAEAAMTSAQAQKKQAQAVQSKARLAWWKAIWSWLFGKKWN